MKLLPPEAEQVDVAMAPLIDCVFLLLIFFLVATTLKKAEPELPIELPFSGASVDTVVEDDLLVIGIDATGQFYLGGESVTTDILHETLKARAASGGSQRVRLDADRSLQYERLIEAIELCQFYGLRNIGLHTRETRKYSDVGR